MGRADTPFVRVDKLGDQISGNAWRAFHMDKSRASSARSASAASSIWRRPLRLLGDVQGLSGRSHLSARQRLKKADEGGFPDRGKISLIARFNSLQGRKKFPVRMRRALARNAVI